MKKHQNLQSAGNAVFKGNFIALNVRIRKKKGLKYAVQQNFL